MFLILCLTAVIIFGCITAGEYEKGNLGWFTIGSFCTAVFFTLYMVGIQS